ncbi:MAG TPA: peptidoglycan-binding domain-containing protein [Trebonia sp.]|nr:peptidoglycan-binding domain-containing protein [Trebonia sp.]
MRILSFPLNGPSRPDTELGARWRKPALGLAAVMVAATAAFATVGSAGAATAAPAAPAASATPIALTAPAAATLTWPLVVQGASGERVVAIQYLLNQKVAAGLVVDGKFGAKTEAAVRDFQKKFKLPVDGVVGPATWNALITHEK